MASQSNSPCETCAVHSKGHLIKLGIKMEGFDFVVALAGNPNTGKSTVFNQLTGLKQHTGNWPGKTVTRAEGGFSFAEHRYKLVDLPGTYSLLSNSSDEDVARNFILFGKPDVTVVVIDATRIERNLNLVLQILEITDRVVVCLNLMDEAERHGLKIDERSLARDLGVPVIPTAARDRTGIPELLRAIDAVAMGEYKTKPYRITYTSKEQKAVIDKLTGQITKVFPTLPNARWVAMRLLEGDQQIARAVRTGDLTKLGTKSAQVMANAV